jgi:uncharacterized protein
MNVERLSIADYIVQPWKNGGGRTAQIAVGGGDARWQWRASIADVDESGAFSNFEGYDRTIALVEGNGMLLSFDRAPNQRIERLHVPFAFDGGWKAHCQLLNGPVRDLNLMADRRTARGSMDVVSIAESAASLELVESDNGCDLLYCLDGTADAMVAGRHVIIAKGETLRVDGGGGHSLAIRSTAAAVTLAHMKIQSR